MARVFTGCWTQRPRQGRQTLALPQPHDGKASQHYELDAAFLGTTIPRADAPRPCDRALDTLFNHPNTAPFIGRQLIQRLVTSAPSGPTSGGWRPCSPTTGRRAR
jgi:uncharacterized protein (DUF1800 family)